VPDSNAAVFSWRKSSASASGDCVEVAAHDGYILLRDSKKKHSQTLKFTSVEWEAFLECIRSGQLKPTGLSSHCP
jgi:hypothetical protein